MSVDHFMTVAMTRLKDLGVVDKEASDNQGFELGQVRWPELFMIQSFVIFHRGHHCLIMILLIKP